MKHYSTAFFLVTSYYILTPTIVKGRCLGCLNGSYTCSEDYWCRSMAMCTSNGSCILNTSVRQCMSELAHKTTTVPQITSSLSSWCWRHQLVTEPRHCTIAKYIRNYNTFCTARCPYLWCPLSTTSLPYFLHRLHLLPLLYMGNCQIQNFKLSHRGLEWGHALWLFEAWSSKISL